ncbi:ATP-binding cassette domain-containing protein [Desulfopila sp. IMCC35008]|uniref:ATP-binding cassette domain-containing protein n=1 Tax=Desulfopila sp. IMCC35008 TaxID=2653858 RepID=UPI003517B78D
MQQELETLGIKDLFGRYPFLNGYLAGQGLNLTGDETVTIPTLLAGLDPDEVEDKAIDTETLTAGIVAYIEQMLQFIGGGEDRSVSEVTLYPGTDKSGTPEQFEQLTIRRGEIVCIVGPTGSGKSRLLADIEWMAQKDTPTSRQVLVNGKEPDPKWRFSSSDKLVAQLSQNMNFVMDLTVEEFVRLHADSRMVNNADEVVKNIIHEANELAGEQFTPDTAITSLSGGQSRALMIADTAILSRSPIVLIDEIENAGIDRKKALRLLLNEDKIVLMATHDPMLALMGDRRIVIKNGGIHKVIDTDNRERAILSNIEALDRKVQSMRQMLRQGESLEYFSF